MKDRAPMPPGHWRGPREHFELPPPRGFGGMSFAHAVFPWLFLLLFAALVTVAIIALIRFTKQSRHGQNAGFSAPVSAAAPDQALQDLRVRYARGDISREEYLQKSADLGEPRPMPPPPAPPAR